MNDNVVPFPLRGRRLMAAAAKVVEAAGRPMLTSEIAEALGLGETSSVVYEALQQLQSHGAVKCHGRQGGAA